MLIRRDAIAGGGSLRPLFFRYREIVIFTGIDFAEKCACLHPDHVFLVAGRFVQQRLVFLSSSPLWTRPRHGGPDPDPGGFPGSFSVVACERESLLLVRGHGCAEPNTTMRW